MARRGMVVGAFFAVMCLAARAEPFCWHNGQWDDTRAPQGALLTDNFGWWGRSVYTGVTYSYEGDPTSPRDILMHDATACGRRLLAGDSAWGWHRTVGRTGGRPLVVVFDFKRPCAFNEVDLLSQRTTNACGTVQAGFDGTNWSAAVSFTASSEQTRVRLSPPLRGSRLRISFKSSASVSYLDEVLAWGEGEVSARHPEDIVDIPPGDSCVFTGRRDMSMTIVPMPNPTLTAKPSLEAVPAPEPILMARNETEVRYFAVVNAGGTGETVALSASADGAGLSAELLVGGVVRMTPPRAKLTPKQINDLLVKDESELFMDRPQRLDVQPFFRASSVPPLNFARRHLANPRQVADFPSAVPLAPGEGCVVMLRISASAAAPGLGHVGISAGKASLSLPVDVRDVTLPDPPIWIHAYSPFTRQFPFESASRVRRDAERLAALGVSSCYGLPLPRTKPAHLRRMRPHTIHAVHRWIGDTIGGAVHHGKWGHFDAATSNTIVQAAHAAARRIRDSGIAMRDGCIFTPDEPGRHNAALQGEMARIVRAAEPELQIYMNPCFWERGYPPDTAILDSLRGFYGECVDISCPIHDLVRKGGLLTKELWTAPRRVNAQYLHPAGRAGRRIAWSSFRNGLNGFAYYCYYAPRGNPWDIRTWTNLDYRYQMVFPLENDVAVTPLYERMREAWEDYRTLAALKASGQDGLLEELLLASESALEHPDPRKPSAATFQALRDRAMAAFGR